MTVPPGPEVVPLTLPSPAVIDVDIEFESEFEGAASPFFSSTVLQLADGDDVVPDPADPELELLELLELV